MNPLLYHKSGKPRQVLINMLWATDCTSLQELAAKVHKGEIYPSELSRLRGVGREILAMFFPMGTNSQEIARNVARKHRDILAARMVAIQHCIARGKHARAFNIAAKPLPCFDPFSGARIV